MELNTNSKISLQIPNCVVPIMEQNRNLEKIKDMRKHLSQQIGITIAPIHIKDNLELPDNELVVFVDKQEYHREQFPEAIHLGTIIATLGQTIDQLST